MNEILAHVPKKNNKPKGISFLPETFQEHANLNLPELTEQWAEDYAPYTDDDMTNVSCYKYPVHLDRNIKKLLGGTEHTVQNAVNALVEEGIKALDYNVSTRHLFSARGYLDDPNKEFDDLAYNSIVGFLEDWPFQIPHFQTKTNQRNFRIHKTLHQRLGYLSKQCLGLSYSTLVQILIVWGLSRCNGALQGSEEIQSTAASFLDGLRMRARIAACLLEALELDSTEEIRTMIQQTKAIPKGRH